MKHNFQSGFTLIELLLYVAIVSFLLVSVVSFYGLVVDSRIKNQSIAEVNVQGQQAMDIISQTIRNASSITAPATGSSGTSATIVVPTGSLSPTTFSLNGSVLQITQGANSPVALTSSRVLISSLAFTNLSRSGTNGIIRVSFAVSNSNQAGLALHNYQKTFVSSAEIGW